MTVSVVAWRVNPALLCYSRKLNRHYCMQFFMILIRKCTTLKVWLSIDVPSTLSFEAIRRCHYEKKKSLDIYHKLDTCSTNISIIVKENHECIVDIYIYIYR